MEELDFSKVQAPVVLTPQYILSKVDQIQIMAFYAGYFKLGKAFKSPLGGDDNPSARIISLPDGNLLFQDFRKSGYLNCWQLVKKLYSCNFDKALKIIATDFGLLQEKSKVSKSFLKEVLEIDKEIKRDTLIQFEPDSWKKPALKFWKQGEITQKELEQSGDIFNIKRLYVNHQEIYNPNHYQRFAYIVDCEINGVWEKRVKIYSPYDKKMKFLSSVPLNCPGNLKNLPHTDSKILINKSRKDQLVLSRYFTDMCWLQNESESSFPEHIIKKLAQEYERIIVLMGSDPHAVGVCTNITKKYNLEYFNTAKSDYELYAAEDPFDIVSMFGRKELERQLQTKGLL